MRGKSMEEKAETFWSYWFPLGKLEADWEQVDFIFFDEGRVQVHTISMRRVTGFALKSPGFC
jgi:hypothetical protein